VTKELINPNWHVVLIHFPLGVFVLGILMELLSAVYRGGSLRTAARWMILLGALAGIPAALSGVYALGNVVRMSMPGAADMETSWKDVVAASTLNTEQWEFLRRHVLAQSASTALAVVLVTIGLGCTDRWRRRLYVPLFVGLLASLAGMVWGAYYGGEMVYRHGTAVLAVEPKGPTTQMASQDIPATSAAEEQVEAKRSVVEYVLPPLQLHVVLAGLAVAFALAALGLSMRSVALAGDARVRGHDDDDHGDDFSTERDMLCQPAVPRGPAAIDVARSLNPEADIASRPVRLPVSRTWLLATLLALGAAVAGVWTVAGTDGLRHLDVGRLMTQVKSSQRMLLHGATGVTIVVVPLLLALVTRVSRRPKVLLTLLGLVLVLAVSAQVWLGVLLMLDTEGGSVYRFNPGGGASASQPAAPAPAPATAPATQGIASGGGEPPAPAN
jgi:uncharacterized membrane protein